MKIKTTSIPIGMLFVTAAFLLAQALSPNNRSIGVTRPVKFAPCWHKRDGNLRSSNNRESGKRLHLRGENQKRVRDLEGRSCYSDGKQDVPGTEGSETRSLRQRRHGEALARVSGEREPVPVARLFKRTRQCDVRDLAAAIGLST